MRVEKELRATKHSYVMPAKKLVYQAMVAMPALFLMGLGVKARTENDTFQFTQPTPKQNAAILDYQQVVRDSAHLPVDSFRVPEKASARRIGQEWVAQAKAGKLQPLQPISFDDSMRDGVKSEILTRNSTTTSALLYIAAMEMDAHQYEAGVRDAMLGMQVTDVIKYSDYSTVLEGAIYERRGFKLIAEALPHMSQQDRLAISKVMPLIQPKPNRFESVQGIEHIVFVEYLNRQHPKSTPIESIAPYNGGGFKALAGHFHGELLASSKDDEVPLAGQLQAMAEEGEADVTKLYGQVLAMTQAGTATQLALEKIDAEKVGPIVEPEQVSFKDSAAHLTMSAR